MTTADLCPWLVGDIGGTNARFGLVYTAGGAVDDIVSIKSADFPTLEDAALAYLAQVGQRRNRVVSPGVAAIAVAGAIHGDTATLTNHNWTIASPNVAAALNAKRVLLLNDFEANALALPKLTPDDLLIVGSQKPARGLPMAVVGPGTGLGVGSCTPAPAGHWVALASEGGHATASAADDFESEVLRHVRAEFGHASAERVLSGIGMPSLYRAVTLVNGRTPAVLDPAQITERALAGTDPDCVATLDTFCAMLGSFAGNVALTTGARGGLFICGGIVPRIQDFFVRSQFRQRFEAKGRLSGYLALIATALVTAPHPAMIGGAQAIEMELALAAR